MSNHELNDLWPNNAPFDPLTFKCYEEELEDDEGNVYNRKTYDDLKKQGLI